MLPKFLYIYTNTCIRRVGVYIHMPNYINNTLYNYFGNIGNINSLTIAISSFKVLPIVLPKHFIMVTLVTHPKYLHLDSGNTKIF
jgi:hypothetical protein